MHEVTPYLINGLVRRTVNTDELKKHIRSTGAKLSRKGRSRIWKIDANTEQMLMIIQLIGVVESFGDFLTRNLIH